MTAPRHHVVVFGATSFAGRLLVRYLLEEFGLRGRLRWAIAGRSMTRLEALRKSLGPQAAPLPILVAESHDELALGQLCDQASVVISTVGPYALHGDALVKVCAESGTDYCDLAGEVQWIRRMQQAHERTARKSGARIVHCCGFDSIPSDLGVHFLQQQSIKRFGQPCTQVKMRVRRMRGGFSGGTFASMLNLFGELRADPGLRKVLANPYALCPDGYAPRVRQPNPKFAQYDADFGAWTAPFIMSAINTRVVQRTNALSKQAYGANFRYDEAMLAGRGVRGRVTATAISTGLAGFMVAGSIAPLRAALQRFVLPAPGEGPSPQAQQLGGYDLRFFGRTEDGRSLRVKVTGDGDPGYASTARMLGQAGACLALDVHATDRAGGFWTPATAFGDRLVKRLIAHSGLTFDVTPD
jgi:short subunit dehydrogenase-like uncharacterized protein